MSTLNKLNLKAFAATAALAASLVLPAQAYTVFADLPTNVNLAPETESRHGVGGPIIADDFVPSRSGIINKVEWWGSFAADTRWEIALHTDNPALHQPNVDDPIEGGLIKYGDTTPLIVGGVADVPGHADIFHYVAELPGPLFMGISAGRTYWFTVANFSEGWNWADALSGPIVGSENYNAHVSTGIGACGDGGPHCGPWTDVHQDFAFRVSAVPEPATALLAGLGLALIYLLGGGKSNSRRRHGA